jgi:putative transposase
MNMGKHTFNRQSIRLRGYDYSQPGFYFATICVHSKTNLEFGKIIDDAVFAEMYPVEAGSEPASTGNTTSKSIIRLNEYGQIANRTWYDHPNHINDIVLDEFIIMPNHVHGIIQIVGSNNKTSLSEIIRQIKTFSAIRINQLRGTPGIKFWQRNYYEHIIRDNESLNRIRKYIRENPMH